MRTSLPETPLTPIRCFHCGEADYAFGVPLDELAALYATVALAQWLRSVTRRAEVERARLEIHTFLHSEPTTFEQYMDAAGALDRLARLAMEADQ